MSVDGLPFQNNYLLTNFNLLSQCCCESFIYWEAVPCESYQLPSDVCNDWDSCVYDERRFVNTRTICNGTGVYVCECQRLKFNDWTSLVTSGTNVARWCLNSNYNLASGTFSDTAFTTSVRYTGDGTIYNNTFNYSDYTIIQGLADAVNAYNPGGHGPPFTLFLDKVNVSGIVDTFANSGYTNNTALTCVNLTSKLAGIYLSWDEFTTDFIELNTSVPLFASGIKSKLRNITGLSNIDVTGLLDSPQAYFHIIFKEDQCGIEQPNLLLQYRLFGSSSPPNDPLLTYGDYTAGFGLDGSNYTDINDISVPCPYENDDYVSPSGHEGYAVYTSGIQCCPQRGTHLGPSQNICDHQTYGSDFEFLENTVYMDDGGIFRNTCYKLSPFYFIFGKEGRFDDDPIYNGSVFIRSDCNYSSSGDCDDYVPCTCTPELFIPAFNQSVPWGPFGSYYSGIEVDKHTAYDLLLAGSISAGQNYMADNAQSGWHYSPSGIIRSKGNWTSTTGIELEFYFYKFVPFFVGTGNPSFNDHVLGKIDATTVSSGLTISSGNTGSGNTRLLFNCSGKTVMNFINAVNAVKTVSVTGQSCNVFAFCPAANSDILSLSASKINNLSTELFDVWQERATNDPTYRISDPNYDLLGYSASSIWPNPKTYDNMSITSNINPTLPNGFNTNSVTRSIQMPPPCRRTNNYAYQGSGNYDFIYRHNCRPFWTSMVGCRETLLNVTKNTSTTGFDPAIDSLTIAVSGRIVTIIASSGATQVVTTGINTNFGGSGYKQWNLGAWINSLSFPKTYSSGTFYPPLLATTGDITYDVYIDDGTWWDGTLPKPPGTGSRTPNNWGYIEPLSNLSSTELMTQSSSAEIQAWIRNRCISDDYDICGEGEPPRCIPPNSPVVDPPIRVNCTSDSEEEGNWLSTYGCNSTNCKEEWFIQAQRCSCSTYAVCNTENDAPIFADHPVNRETNYTCEVLSQPTLYICEQNIHSDCDIPFLIKVPYQYICVSGSSNCYFGNCWQMPNGSPCFIPECRPNGTGLPSSIQLGYSVPNLGCMAGITDYCSMNNGYNGWCQYIDPSSPILIRKRDIPRSWPPTAYVMEKTDSPFCTTYVNPFDLPADDPPCEFGKYDSIGSLWPWVPYEYIAGCDSDHPGWPCFMENLSSNPLFAYIRPVIKAESASGICGYALDGLITIDCNTRCCYCGYGCDFDGIHSICRFTENINRTYESISPLSCCWIHPSGATGAGVCQWGLGCACASDPLPATFPPQYACLDGTTTVTQEVDFTRYLSESLIAGFTLDDFDVCQPVYTGPECCWGPSGVSDTLTINEGCGGSCWWNCCGTVPDRGCGGYGSECEVNDIINLGCFDNPLSYTYEYVTSSGLTAARYDCPGPCPGIGCGSLALVFSETFTYQISSNSIDDCGLGSITFHKDDVTYYQGTNTHAVCSTGVGGLTLGIKFGGGGADYSCGCGSWAGDYIYQGTATTTLDGTYSKSLNSCTDCNYDSINAQSYNYIINYHMPWLCGYPNSDYTSVTGSLYGV